MGTLYRFSSQSLRLAITTNLFYFTTIIVWCSFYDDFCQLARQTAYLAHSQYDPERSARVEAIREQLLMRRQLAAFSSSSASAGATGNPSERYADELDGSSLMFEQAPEHLTTLRHHHNQQQQQHQLARAADRLPLGCNVDSIDRCAAARQLLLDAELADESFLHQRHSQLHHQHHQQQQHLTHTNSVQSVDLALNELAGSLSDVTDSPRSLDHYYGFGPNYHRRLRAYSQQAYHAHPAEQPPPPSQQSQQQQRQLHTADDRDAFNARAIYAPGEHSSQLEYRAAQVGVATAGPMQTARAASYSPPLFPAAVRCLGEPDELAPMCEQVLRPPVPPARRTVTVMDPHGPQQQQPQQVFAQQPPPPPPPPPQRQLVGTSGPVKPILGGTANAAPVAPMQPPAQVQPIAESANEELPDEAGSADQRSASSANEQDKWSDSDADAIVRGAKETAQMALSMYQFTRGEGDLNTTQDLFTQAELFAEEANELYKEVRCFSYKVSGGALEIHRSYAS